MSMRIDCQGCCRAFKAGVEFYRCDRTECGFWTFKFVVDGKVLPTAFT